MKACSIVLSLLLMTFNTSLEVPDSFVDMEFSECAKTIRR